MRGRPWSAAADALLRELYPCTRTDALPRRLQRSHSAIKNRVAALHLRKNDDVSMRRRWHPDEDAVLRMLYPDTPTDAIAQQLDRSVSSAWQRARKLKLEKDAAYLASEAAGRLQRNDHRGRLHWYPKGHVPANKGLRRPGWSTGRMKETQFKKGARSGQAARNWMPIGSTRLMDGYRYTKVADHRNVPYTRNWRPTHVLLWEKHRGRVPRGHALKFVNGDRTDIRLENLDCITRRELMARNTIHNLPAPLPQTIQLLGALKRKINRRSRHNEEQDRRSA